MRKLCQCRPTYSNRGADERQRSALVEVMWAEQCSAEPHYHCQDETNRRFFVDTPMHLSTTD